MPVINHEFNAVVKFYGSLVRHTYTSSQYADFAEMKADYERTGSIKINTEFSKGTIFGDPSVNWLFRAWHDYCHILVNGEFTRDGEQLAMEEQIRQVSNDPSISPENKKLFARYIEIEVMGQVDYYEKHKDFPPNQYQFFLDTMKAQDDKRREDMRSRLLYTYSVKSAA